MNLSDLQYAQEKLSILKNPFGGDKLTGMNLFCYISLGKWVYMGKLEFKNGSTKGEQHFEGKDPADILRQMETFIKTLENQNV